MSASEETLKRIHSKLQDLLKQQALLVRENHALKHELGLARDLNGQYQSQLGDLRQQSEIWKYSLGTMDEVEKKLFEKKLTVYIRELDRCIAMLGS